MSGENSVRLWVPILKSVACDDGRIRVEGIATDERLDLQDEVVKAVHDALEYSRAGWTKFDYDHGANHVGDVTEVCLMDGPEIASHFRDELNGQPVVGKGIYAAGYVLSIGDPALAPEDLKKAHFYLKSGSRMGFSIHGPVRERKQFIDKSGKSYTVAVPKFYSRIAITPHPVNMGAPCRMVKSLHDAFT